MTARQPALFIPHGGGPCFFMPPRPGFPSGEWDGMEAFLRHVSDDLPERPRAILVISGHWEEAVATVNSAAHPSLYFDYYGFPPETYQLTYPVAGDPALADEVRGLLERAGFASGADDQRGLDHGVFIPFKVAFPAADIPLVQLSLLVGLDPARHIAMGRALAGLRDQGVLIIGSGMSFHNLRVIYADNPDVNLVAEAFDRWLEVTCCDGDIVRREAALAAWAQAPGARLCHPREEHLIPLMVAAGAGGDAPGTRIYAGMVMGKRYAGFRFG